MICVQVKSVKQHKMEGSECKQKLSTIKDKENLDSQTIPNQKVRKVSKKKYNLNKNVLKNQLNLNKVFL